MASHLCNPPPPPPAAFPRTLRRPSLRHPSKYPHATYRICYFSTSSKCFSPTPLPPPPPPSSIRFTPPVSREEAIRQARSCLSSTLQKPLNNPLLFLPRQKKVKKQRQTRLRVEIPVVDDSPDSQPQLVLDVFSDLPITTKGARPCCILLLWPDPALKESALQVFAANTGGSGSCNPVVNADLGSVRGADLDSADVVVFVSPESSSLDDMRRICDDDVVYRKPVVLFNPKWAFEEESGFGKERGSFAGSFEVVYSFLGLEVKGILSRRKGVVLRCVKDGAFGGRGDDEWLVFVEDDRNKSDLKVVSNFKRRPEIGDVETVLYNLMAANSPVTRSLKFIKDLASNVTGTNQKS